MRRQSPDETPQSLARLQKRMLQEIYGRGAGKSRGRAKAGSDRLALYRDLTHHALEETALAVYSATYRAMESLGRLGDWERSCSRFFLSHPPVDYRLNYAVKGLEASLPPVRWVRELARYEWARYEARSAPDAAPGAVLPAGLSLLSFRFDVPSWYAQYAANPSAKPSGPPARFGREALAAVFRDTRSLEVRAIPLQAAVRDLIDNLLQGYSLDDCAEAISEATGRALPLVRQDLRAKLDAALR